MIILKSMTLLKIGNSICVQDLKSNSCIHMDLEWGWSSRGLFSWYRGSDWLGDLHLWLRELMWFWSWGVFYLHLQGMPVYSLLDYIQGHCSGKLMRYCYSQKARCRRNTLFFGDWCFFSVFSIYNLVLQFRKNSCIFFLSCTE